LPFYAGCYAMCPVSLTAACVHAFRFMFDSTGKTTEFYAASASCRLVLSCFGENDIPDIFIWKHSCLGYKERHDNERYESYWSGPSRKVSNFVFDLDGLAKSSWYLR